MSSAGLLSLTPARTPRAFRLAVAAIMLFAGASAGLPQSGTANPLLNRRAPDFIRNDLAGRPVHLAALRGRVVLLNFWATWCAPCQAETPRFIVWQRHYAPEGLAVVGVSMDDDAAPVRAFQQNFNVPYPLVMGDDKLGLRYGGVLGLPTTYLIDRAGIIRARLEGETDLDELESKIRSLLAAPAGDPPAERPRIAARAVSAGQ